MELFFFYASGKEQYRNINYKSDPAWPLLAPPAAANLRLIIIFILAVTIVIILVLLLMKTCEL